MKDSERATGVKYVTYEHYPTSSFIQIQYTAASRNYCI